MIAFLADEDFNGRIIRGISRRIPDISLLTANDAGLAGQPESIIISWAANDRRILLTHDVNTMIDAALDRVRSGQTMAGVIAVPQQFGIGAAISELTLIAVCAEPSELAGQMWYLPL